MKKKKIRLRGNKTLLHYLRVPRIYKYRDNFFFSCSRIIETSFRLCNKMRLADGQNERHAGFKIISRYLYVVDENGEGNLAIILSLRLLLIDMHELRINEKDERLTKLTTFKPRYRVLYIVLLYDHILRNNREKYLWNWKSILEVVEWKSQICILNNIILILYKSSI